MSNRAIAASIAGVTLIAAAIVCVHRGGAIAGLTLVAAGLLLAKIRFKPSPRDWAIALGIAVVPALLWVATLRYVIATYESGEVVELAIDTDTGLHTARLWIMDMGPDPTVYYDAPPQAAAALLAGKRLQMTRGAIASERIPQASRFDGLPQPQADGILQAMQEKYGDRYNAAIVFYVLLGSPRDRITVVATLAEP